jgi:hypothetical protein
MKQLITKNDIKEFKNVSIKRDDAVFDQMIEDATHEDLRILLCEDLFNDLLLENGNNDLLWNGGTYVYEGKTYVLYGLKRVLVQFAYSRYFRYGIYTDTPYSMVTKDHENSTAVSDKARETIYTANRQQAMTYWDNCRKFMVRTNYDYDNCGCAVERGNINGFRINKIG